MLFPKSSDYSNNLNYRVQTTHSVDSGTLSPNPERVTSEVGSFSAEEIVKLLRSSKSASAVGLDGTSSALP